MLEQQNMSVSKELEQSNSSYSRNEVKNTPFTICGSDEKGFIIVMGNEQICPVVFKDVKEAIKHINKKPWKLIMIACAIFTNKVNQIQNESEKTN